MNRYLVGDKEKLVDIQEALDKANGLRDVLGKPTPKPQMVHHPELGYVRADYLGIPAYDLPGTHWPMIEGDDGSCCVELPEFEKIDDHLKGDVVYGIAMPRVRDLARARDLLGDVATIVDDRLLGSVSFEDPEPPKDARQAQEDVAAIEAAPTDEAKLEISGSLSLERLQDVFAAQEQARVLVKRQEQLAEIEAEIGPGRVAAAVSRKGEQVKPARVAGVGRQR